LKTRKGGADEKARKPPEGNNEFSMKRRGEMKKLISKALGAAAGAGLLLAAGTSMGRSWATPRSAS
jgi:hypothetical protein